MIYMRVAIIGMGTAGVSVLRQLVKHENFSQLKVDVYDDDRNMGQGVPFQNDSSELLINMPSKSMSLNLDDDQEFWKCGIKIRRNLILVILNICLDLYLVII